MGMTSIKVGSTLTFDEQQEQDIIKLVTEFKESHKIGEFLSNLLRLAIENPELVVSKNGKYDTGTLARYMEALGKTPTRHNYMNEINKKIVDMQTKVDEIYDMCLKMYTLAEMGKTLGFEQKTDNMVLAQFMVEQQLGKLRKSLGVDSSNFPFESNRITNCKEKASDTLEYIISCYEPIINELKKELVIKPVEIKVKELEIPVKQVVEQVEQQVQTIQPVVSQPVQTVQEVKPVVAQPIQPVQPVQTVKKEELKLENIDKIDDNDEIDLGDTVTEFTSNSNDLADLMNFFNDD